jgi:hypothetical protein
MRVVGLLVGPVAHGPAPPRPQALQCVRELSLGTSELQLHSASLRWLQMRSRGVRRAKSALYLTSDQIPRHKARSFLPRYAVRRWSWITTLLVRLDRHQFSDRPGRRRPSTAAGMSRLRAAARCAAKRSLATKQDHLLHIAQRQCQRHHRHLDRRSDVGIGFYQCGLLFHAFANASHLFHELEPENLLAGQVHWAFRMRPERCRRP